MPRLSAVLNRIKWCTLGACATLLACYLLLGVMDKLTWNNNSSGLVFVRGGTQGVGRCKRLNSSGSLEDLGKTRWGLKNVRDIKLATINTAIENPDVKPIGCGISFSADIEQMTKTGDCVVSRVAVKSVFSNLSHYQGESHLREIKTHYLDLILGTGLTVPSSLIVLPFSALNGKHAIEIKRAVDCDISDKAFLKTGVTAYVASWVPNLGAYPKLTPSLAKRIHPDNFFTYVTFLYIANCMKSGHSHFADSNTLHYVMIDNDRCLLPESVSALDMPLHYRKRLTRIGHTLFRDGHVCSVPSYLIRRLQTANSASSATPSVGTQLRKMFAANETTSHLVLHEDPEIYEETDGRIARLLAEYNHRCSARDVSKYDGDVFKSFKESRIPHEYLVDDKQHKIEVELEVGLTGVATFIGTAVGTTTVQPALAQLLAYYIDRLTGINKMPTVVYRQLRLDDISGLKGVLTSEGKLTHSVSDYHDISPQLKVVPSENESVKHPKLQVSTSTALQGRDVIIVGNMKDLHDKAHIHHEGSLRDFFLHEASFKHLKKTKFSRQTLVDMSDIFLLDFLVHRPDRKHVGKSELRLVSTGNDKAWWRHPNRSVCSAILRCPPLLYHTDWSIKSSACNQTCDHHVNTYFSNCRFRQTTVQRIRNIREEDLTLGKLLEMTIGMEKSLPSILGVEEMKSSTEGLDERVEYFLKYVDMCEGEYKKDVLV